MGIPVVGKTEPAATRVRSGAMRAILPNCVANEQKRSAIRLDRESSEKARYMAYDGQLLRLRMNGGPG